MECNDKIHITYGDAGMTQAFAAFFWSRVSYQLDCVRMYYESLYKETTETKGREVSEMVKIAALS